MILAVCSDIHDNIWALETALSLMGRADAVLFCGDFCAPFSLVQLAEGCTGTPIHIVWGNNDGDRWMLAQNASRFDQVTLHGELARLTLDGLCVGLTHYPEIAQGLAQSGTYDVVCYGHDHLAHQEKAGDCHLLNPGEIMGRLGRSSFLTFDTNTGIADLVEIANR